MKQWFLLVCLALLPGCATKGAEQAGLGYGARVGIVNLMQPQLSHYHVGTDALANFDKRYTLDTDLPGFVTETLRRRLRATERGYALVTIEPTPELLAIGRNAFGRLQLEPNRNVAASVQQLARQHELEHVLVVSEVCGPRPPPRYGEKCGYGLYTDRGSDGALRAAAYFDVAVLRLMPDGDLLRPVTTLGASDTISALPGWQPKDVERLTPDEIGLVEPVVRRLALRRIEDSIKLVR